MIFSLPQQIFIRQLVIHELDLFGNNNYPFEWEVVIIIADTLQAYNEIEGRLNSNRECWEEIGKAWEETAQKIFEPLIELFKQKSLGSLNFYHWDESLKEANKKFQFINKLQKHVDAYANNQDFNNAVDQKGNDYLSRRYKFFLPVKLLPPKNLTYILEEIALLMGCMAEGLFFNIDKQNPIFLLYPGAEELAFSIGKTLLKNPLASDVRWREYKLNAKDYHSKPQSQYRGCSNDFNCPCKFANRQIVKEKLLKHHLLDYQHPHVFPDLAAAAKIFVNRQEYTTAFTELNQKLILICYGLGGMGKTELVAQYFNAAASNNIPTIWLESKKDSDIMLSIRRLLKRNKIDNIDKIKAGKEIQSLFYKWLTQQKDFVLVFNNVENYRDVIGYIKFVQELGRGKIIVTARQKPSEPELQQYCQEIKELNRAQTSKLIKKYLQTKNVNESDIDEIHKYFAGFTLPLALFLKQPGLKPENLLRSLNDIKGPGDMHDIAKSQVLRILEYSKRKLPRQETPQTKLALAILDVCIFLDWDYLDESLIRSWCDRYDENSHLNLRQAICLLVEAGYINEHDRKYNFHPFVHETLREKKREEYLAAHPNELTEANIQTHYNIIATLADMVWHRFDEDDFDEMVRSFISFFNHARRHDYYLSNKIKTNEHRVMLYNFLTPRLIIADDQASFLQQLESLGKCTAICIMFKDPRGIEFITQAMALINTWNIVNVKNSMEINAVIKFLVADYVFNSKNNPIEKFTVIQEFLSNNTPENKAVILKLLTAISFVCLSNNQEQSLKIIQFLQGFLADPRNTNFFTYLIANLADGAFGQFASASVEGYPRPSPHH